jgi:hypothetical protein
MAVLGADANNDQKVRSVLTPLGEIAAQTGAAIVMVRHLTKGGGKSALHRGGGSMGIMGAARSAMLFARDPDDATLRVLASTKSNLGPIAPSIRFAFKSTSSGVATIDYIGTAKQNADALLATSNEPEKRTQLTEAIDVLRDALAHGPIAVPDMQEMMREAGLSWATARRAQVQLGIVSEKAGFSGGWQWRLPEGAHTGGVSAFTADPDVSMPIVDGNSEGAQPHDTSQPEDAQPPLSTFVVNAGPEPGQPIDKDPIEGGDATPLVPAVAVRQHMLL